MTCLNIHEKEMGFDLKIMSVPGKGRGLFKIFIYSRLVHCWSPCFIVHNYMEILYTCH